MSTINSHDFEDWPDWPLRNSQRASYMSAITPDSETASLLSINNFPSPSSPSASDKSKGLQSPPTDVTRLDLHPSVTMYVPIQGDREARR
jgi:hypothetical protein